MISRDKIRLISKLFFYPTEIPEFSSEEKIFLEKNEFNFKFKKNSDEIQSEYTRLFINAIPEVTCPPYASIYIDGQFMSVTTVKIQKLYSKYNLFLSSKEIGDHISVEFEFLAFLMKLKEEKQDVEKDCKFLIAHIKMWTEDFFNRIKENDKIGIWKKISEIAEKVINDIYLSFINK